MTRHLSAVLFSTLLLGACATMIDTPFQEVTLKTPGTDQARCLLDNDITVYPIHSNQTIKMQRNDSDIKITCTAPGNKNVSTVIDRDLNAWSIANITNAIVPGVTYDHFSGALYDYPNVISVDFGAVAGPGFPLPEYHAAGTPRPVDQGIENYNPSVPKKNGDPHQTNYVPRKMDMGEIRSRSNPLGTTGSGGSSGSAYSSGGSVDIYNP